MPSYMSVLATALALFSATNAHMVLGTPAPYGKASLNSSPLDPSGSDFPCKQRPGVYDPALTKNVMPIGATQTLKFIGSAVHGGGSCQVSLTKDLKPTKDSKWMVIHSIEGGCPAKAVGNLGGDPNANVAATFDYKIPQGISAGEYTLAWTWFNRVGNREMYMNCAPITVTGGSQRRDLDMVNNATETYATDEIFKRDASFPEMFIANIPSTDCKSPEDKDTIFPNPGASLEKAGDAANLAPPQGPKCGGGSSGGSSNAAPAAGGSASGSSAPSGSSSGSGSSGSASSGSGSSPAAPAPSPATTSIIAIPPAGASPPMAAASSVASAAQSVVSAAASVMSAAAPAAPAATGSSSSGAASSSSGCTSGTTVCSPDGKQFGTCDNGKVTMMPVAAGTSCKNGAIGFAKRSAKFGKAFNA